MEIINLIYSYCTDFVINMANITNLSYYEINFLIFVILFPSCLVLSLLSYLYLINKYRKMKGLL
jgi:hypothetical protein